ncbi:MAG: NTP transferase domain-containing protein [Nitrospira sp. SB0675_bin_23]|nr:NTP transferase domain-containing protein [Nitrospira sp. SB0675_bin_23]
MRVQGQGRRRRGQGSGGPHTGCAGRKSRRRPALVNRRLYAVILAGGSGTRFWPASRERFPKQLLQLIGEETLIQQTVRRVLKIVPVQNVYVVTNMFQAETIKRQLSNWKSELAGNILNEKESRNTAPAIG